MQKKVTLIVVGLLAIFLLVGCTRQSDSETKEAVAEDSKKAAPDGGAAVANPMVEVPDDDAYDKLGVEMDAPDGASDVKYYIISDKLAHISFTYQGMEYTYRGGDPMDNMAGLHGMEAETEETVALGDLDDRVDVKIQTLKDGGCVADWLATGKEYSVSAIKETDIEKFKLIVGALAD